MNERINQFRLDAGISQLHNDPRLVVVGEEGNIIDPMIGLQKFAELIVRECCQKLENDGMVEVAMEMKQHFGVD